ncbi:esterase-like activity of phytase family protein [Roseivivax sp. CAU 1761]
MLRRLGRALSAGAAAALVLIAPACMPAPTPDADRHVWRGGGAAFGGFSGLEVDADGAGFVAIGDRGLVVEGRFRRAQGRIAGVEVAATAGMRRADGAALPEPLRDAEGLARSASGRRFVSLEGRQRVAELMPGGRLRDLPRAEAFRRLSPNGGLEALAVDDRGRLYVVPERRVTPAGIPVWRYDGRAWSQAADLPARDGFHPVGADFGPDGRFYLLERSFNGIGFRSRVRSFAFGPDGAAAERTVFASATGAYDNLEGLAVWRDRAGRIVLTMLSDDNFMFFQRTEFVEFRLNG